MERRKYEDRRRNGSVKAAANMYGERIVDGISPLKKTQEDFPEKHFSRPKELRKTRRDMSRYKESRRASESEKVRAESELFAARKAVKDLASMMEESNFNAKAKMRDTESLSKNRNLESKALVITSIESSRYAEVMRELEFVKQELSKLKLDMASAMADKERAEKVLEESRLIIWPNAGTVEVLRKQIEAANEEHVLVELARIEALKEAGQIEAQREKEAGEFSFRMEEIKKKMEDIIEEIDHSKELEEKLAETLSDIDLLQGELKQVKKPDKMVQSDGLKQPVHNFQPAEHVEPLPSLESIEKELEAANKELAAIGEEGFRYTSSMDIIRNELKQIKKETARLKKTEERADMKVQSLHSKLLKAKSKLEAVTTAEEKAKSIMSNLSLTLEQLKTEAEASKKEKELITKDTAKMKEKIQKTESQMDSTEEKLRAALQELEAVKSSEASALEKLKSLIETTMQSRASASNQSSRITISKFEYEYLTGRAVGAEEIADKKVAAAQAWIEALKAGEREILMKTEMVHRELREMGVAEEHEVNKGQRSVSAKKMIERELRNWRQAHEKNVDAQSRESPFRRRSMKINGNLIPSGRTKFPKSASPAIG